MDEREISRHNEKIACFMGGFVTGHPDGVRCVRWIESDYIDTRELKYHKSWFAIKPVLKRIGLRVTWIEWLVDPEYVYKLVLEKI